MTRADKLFDAVLADPDNAAARNEYRAALRQTNEPANLARSAILDAQCALAGKTASDPNGVQLATEAQSAFRRFADRWFGKGLSFIDKWSSFDCGIEVAVADYLAMDEDTLPFAPIQAIYLCSKNYFQEDEDDPVDEVRSEYMQLAKRPSLRYWLSLTMDEKDIPGECFVELISSPHLVNLRRLYVFECPLGDESVETMADASNLASLRHLCLNSLGDDGEPGDVALAALARSRHITQLNSLYLQGGFTITGVSGLAASPNLENLRSLDLHAFIDGACVAALTSSPHLSRLTEINLGWFNQAMDDSGISALVNWPHLPRIISLGLGGTGMTSEGLRRLASCPGISCLEHLDLSHNHMSDESGVTALAASPYLDNAKKINLWDVSPIPTSIRKSLVRRFGDRVELVPEGDD
jgi:hypothetical protein